MSSVAEQSRIEAVKVCKAKLIDAHHDLSLAVLRAERWKCIAGRVAGLALCFAVMFVAMVVWRMA